jgi:HAD superfamily hydrolase (TIGR01549 family)
MKYNLDLLLFDLDGVLVDTHTIIGQIYRDISEALRRVDLSEMQINEALSKSPRKAMRYLYGDLVQEASSLYDELWNNKMEFVEAYEGIHELLRDLKNLGKAIVTVTSRNAKDSSKILNLANIADFMDNVVTRGDYRIAKPSPACILAALANYGGDSTGTAYVGDMPNDMRSAKSAGCVAIGAIWGSVVSRQALEASGADIIVEKPHEIKDMIIK